MTRVAGGLIDGAYCTIPPGSLVEIRRDGAGEWAGVSLSREAVA
jgi:hypothetical protein